MILPVGPSKPMYRDTYIAPSARYGIDPLSFGAFLRLPQLVLPSKLKCPPPPRRMLERVKETLNQNLYADANEMAPIIVGQLPYQSRISGNQENLPIAGSIAGAPGMNHPCSPGLMFCVPSNVNGRHR